MYRSRRVVLNRSLMFVRSEKSCKAFSSTPIAYIFVQKKKMQIIETCFLRKYCLPKRESAANWHYLTCIHEQRANNFHTCSIYPLQTAA